MTPCDFALNAARRMLDKGGEDVAVLALPTGERPYDYVVIANGRSERQVKTLVDEVYHFCKRHQQPYYPVEGEEGWRLIDCIEVVVHAFTEESRAYYQLDELFSDADVLDHESLIGQLHDPDQDLSEQ